MSLTCGPLGESIHRHDPLFVMQPIVLKGNSLFFIPFSLYSLFVSYTKKSHLTRHTRRSHVPKENEGNYHITTRSKEKLSMASSTDDDEDEEDFLYAKQTSVVNPNYWFTPQCYPIYEPTPYYP